MRSLLRNRRGNDRGEATITGVVATIAVIAVIFGFIAAVNSFTSGKAGYIGVVRNGGPLDNKNIRKDLLPVGAGYTHIGFASTVHFYPVTPLPYTITSDPTGGNRPGVDVEMLPTADGVEVGLEGTIYLTLETTNADTLKQFDNRFGTRTFQGVDGKAYFIWDEGHGVNAFLNQIVRPIISTALRQEIGHANCAELQASCNLILQAAAAANVDPTKTPLNSGTKITDIQNAVNAVLTNDLRDTLGGSYFVNVRFTLSKVTLPKEAQAAINSAQAAFAKVTEAKARVQAAIQDGLANEKRQLGYSKCPTCAQIDMLKALPTGITTYAPGSGIALAVPTNK